MALAAGSDRQDERGVRLVADTNQALSAIVLKVAQIDSVMSHIATLSQKQGGGSTASTPASTR
jgi:methyl-accepting chemotaxis protein